MKKFIAIVIITMISSAIAQEQEAYGIGGLLTQQHYFECTEYYLGAQRLIPDYYAQGKLDSINLIIDYVDDRCDDNRFSLLRVLLAIESGELADDWCDSTLIISLLGVVKPERFSDMGCHISASSMVRPLDDPRFCSLLHEIAFNLWRQADTSSLAHLFCSFYEGSKKWAFNRLRENRYPGTRIQEMYNQQAAYVRENLKRWRTHYAFGLGVWLPSGRNEILGDKSEFSCAYGIHGAKIGVDLFFAYRGFKSSHDILVRYDDSLMPTEHFTGYLLQAQVSRNIYESSHFQLDGFCGLGFDNFSFRAKQDENKNEPLSSPAFSIGANTRLFVNKISGYFGALQFRYDFIDYNNKSGTNLRGNAISVSLAFGRMRNGYAVDEAERLRIFK